MRITISHPDLNKGKSFTKDIPMSWMEVNYIRFLKLADCGDDLAKRLALFTGVGEDILKKAKIENLDVVIQTLAFLDTNLEYQIPETIAGFPVPKNLEFKSIAQFEDLKSEAAKFSPAPENALKNLTFYPLMVATYCAEPYSWEAAEELASKIALAPCPEVLAIGNFILVKLIELKQKQKPVFPKGGTRRNRFGLAIKSYLRLMVFSVRWYLWKRRLTKAGLNF